MIPLANSTLQATKEGAILIARLWEPGGMEKGEVLPSGKNNCTPLSTNSLVFFSWTLYVEINSSEI